MLSRWRTRKINEQIDHCSGLAERILGIKVTNLAESLRTLLFLNINWEIFYFLFFQFKTIFFLCFFGCKITTNYVFVFTNISFSIDNMANHLIFIMTQSILNKLLLSILILKNITQLKIEGLIRLTGSFYPPNFFFFCLIFCQIKN